MAGYRGTGRPGQTGRVLGRRAIREVTELRSVVRSAGELRAALIVASTGTALVAVMWAVGFLHGGRELVEDLAGYRADEPLLVALQRLPLSAAAPTPGLPVWGAMLQVFAALLAGSAVLGWRRAVLVGLSAHVAVTLLVRFCLELPPGVLGQLSPDYRHLLDTGPSVLTVALAAAVAVAVGLPVVGALLLTPLLALALLEPGLPGWEHLLAVAVGLLTGLVARVGRAPVAQLAERPRTGADARS